MIIITRPAAKVIRIVAVAITIAAPRGVTARPTALSSRRSSLVSPGNSGGRVGVTSVEHLLDSRLGSVGHQPEEASRPKAAECLAGDHGERHGQDEADDAEEKATQRRDDEHKQRMDV